MENVTPLTAAHSADPYPYYAHLVAERPFYFDDAIGMWVASSAAAAEAVLASTRLHVRPAAQPVPHAMAATTLGSIFSRLARMTDGTVHDAARRGIVDWMARRASDAYDITLETASRLALDVRDERDLNTYVFDAPAAAMTRLAGIPDSARTRGWAADFARALRPGADATAVDRGNAAVENLLALLPAPQSTLAANVLGLLFQSYDAGAALIACTIAGAGDETPVHNTRRFAAETICVLERKIQEGDCVLVVLAAAHRDPEAKRSYAFGAGSHACPGSEIARDIVRGALDALRRAGAPAYALPVCGYHPMPNVRIPVFGARVAAA